MSLIGRRIGPYLITSLVGKGGMGEVYRARDPRLGRDVAIKVLPEGLAADPDRRARFDREARLLASVNHPHIASLFGLEESNGITAIVLELIEGATLADMLDGGTALPVRQALSLARQIAEALEAAHAKNIVHRDLKPANIKVTADGTVKVLDFGLAKSRAASSDAALSQAATVTADQISGHVVVGTAAYMSPEQARGLPVDARADIWAFGCVLFEMLTGRSPFAGATFSDSLVRVLERDPDWRALGPAVPAAIHDLLVRCLRKDPRERLQTIGEAKAVIDACLAGHGRRAAGVVDAVRWAARRRVVRAILVLAAIAGAGALVYRSRDPASSVPRLANPIQLTRSVGVEDHPSWSGDGSAVAYDSNESGNWDIWTTSIGGSPVNLTADHTGLDLYPSWSPSGRHVAFWSDRNGGGYHIVPAAGGVAELIVPTPRTHQFYHSAPEWSADGTQLAAVSYDLTPRVQAMLDIVTLASHEVRRVPLPGTEESRLDVAWSPDGRFVAYIENAQQQSELGRLRLLRLADGSSVTLTDGLSNPRRPRWSDDGRYLFYVVNRNGPPDLWRQRLDAAGSPLAEPERVTAGLEVRDAAFSRDGRRIVYSKGRWVANVWRVPILESRPATWGDATQVTFDQAYVEFFDVAPDGQRIAYSSDRSGNQDLWVMPFGGQAVQLTFDPAPDWSPNWSPDGRQLAFYSARTGDREIWKMPSTAGAATRVTNSPRLDAGSEWSPDGSEIAIRSERTGNSDVWLISADGTRTRQLTNHPASDGLAAWSPDGKWLVFTSNRASVNEVWMAPAAGGEAQRLAGPGDGPHWDQGGRFVYFNGVGPRFGNIWRVDLDDRTERPMTNLLGRRGEPSRMPPDTDGGFLYFSWREDTGDIWVMDVQEP